MKSKSATRKGSTASAQRTLAVRTRPYTVKRPPSRELLRRGGLPARGSQRDETLARYRIFIIDSGWNVAASEGVRESLALFDQLTPHDPVYVLDRETSLELLCRHHQMIGRDPIICVQFMGEGAENDDVGAQSGLHGCRADLGPIESKAAVLRTMQMFARLIAAFRESAGLERVVRKRLRREGIAGTFQVLAAHVH